MLVPICDGRRATGVRTRSRLAPSHNKKMSRKLCTKSRIFDWCSLRPWVFLRPCVLCTKSVFYNYLLPDQGLFLATFRAKLPLRRNAALNAENARYIEDPREELTFCAKHDEDEETQTWKQRDRKSTRLNSSHSQISYAVFCLKKKKTKKK